MTELPQDDDPAEGLPLQQAIERYSDPQLWAEYCNAAKACPRGPIVWARMITHNTTRADLSRDAYNRWLIKEERRLRSDVLRAFREKLQRGELVASGYERPLRPDAQRVPIRPALWKSLIPHPRTSEAKGDGLHMVHVVVCEPAIEARADPAPAPAPAMDEAPWPAQPSLARDRMWKAIEREMRRRAETGEQWTGNVGEDCRHLAAWAEKKFSGMPHIKKTPEPRSIENKLCDEHRKLRGKRSG